MNLRINSLDCVVKCQGRITVEHFSNVCHVLSYFLLLMVSKTCYSAHTDLRTVNPKPSDCRNKRLHGCNKKRRSTADVSED